MTSNREGATPLKPRGAGGVPPGPDAPGYLVATLLTT
jgi:hypothetical protein